MSLSSPKFKIFKQELKNGMTVLVRPVRHIPRVEVHVWYNVGSKDEGHRERGMAHLIEHMIFKGTKNLTESDINIVCQKLTGDANAFTSQDYTCYTFRLPSHVWEIGLEILADCMQHATFNPQMLSSELKAVIEELKMYREDFQGTLLEHMISSLFTQHPYQNPIIGSKFDLAELERDSLYSFYKKHYHPANAILVVTGDVDPDEAFKAAERYFKNISSPADYRKDTFHFQDDLVTQTTVLRRPVTSPWYSYLYKIPGFADSQNHLIDMATLILATGRSSRLYKRLVNKEQVALDVECSAYDFFEKGIFCIGVWPANGRSSTEIEAIINEEIAHLTNEAVEDWEFIAAKKRTQIDFTSLLESVEKQAFVVGNAYLATRNVHFIEEYLENVQKVTKKQLQEFFKAYLEPSSQHKGYLLPTEPHDLKKLAQLQAESEKLEKSILKKHKRTKPVEPARWAHKINVSPLSTFSYPKPKTFVLSNGLEVIYHHNPLVPQVISILSFKSNYLYETAEQAGIFNLLLHSLTDSTEKYDAQAFAQMLEMEGISIGAGTDGVMMRCLSSDLAKGFSIMHHMITAPSFHKKTLDKIRQQVLNDLEELWDSPIDFVDQIAKEMVYQSHPYHKNPLGSKKSVLSIEKNDLQDAYKRFISPHGAVLVVVGDLSKISLEELAKKHFGTWKGPEVPNLVYPSLPPFSPQTLHVPLDRDQVVLGFAAPSIARADADYNALALLDIIVTGGVYASPSSRLFQLRERSGLFYVIGGSLIQGSRQQPGMSFIKTIVASEKVNFAKKTILDTIDLVGKKGISQDEFQNAKNLLFASSVELFETNAHMAHTFLFLKKLNLSFNLFDKQGEILSILKLDDVNKIARRYCNKALMSTIEIGRVKKEKKNVGKKGESFKKGGHNG